MNERTIYLLSPTPKEGTTHLPMIDFHTVATHLELAGCDTLMFTSKQAVLRADEIDQGWRDYPCIAIGPATRKQIETLGGEVVYHPSAFYGEVLSKEIANRFSDRKVLYLRPKEVSFDAKDYLAQQGITLQEQIIYETRCVRYEAEDAPVKGAIIIFTSPSTIRCFFQHFSWDESYTAVVIGESTKVHLPQEVTAVVADAPLIDSCIEKAHDLRISNPK